MARVNALGITNSMWMTGDCMSPTITPQIFNLVLGMRTQVPSLFRREPTPGSLLAFARVKKGNHRVELVNDNEGPCGYKTKGAVLQVAVVPDTY